MRTAFRGRPLRALFPSCPLLSGLWLFRASYEGVAYEHAFFVGDVIFADGCD